MSKCFYRFVLLHQQGSKIYMWLFDHQCFIAHVQVTRWCYRAAMFVVHSSFTMWRHCISGTVPTLFRPLILAFRYTSMNTFLASCDYCVPYLCVYYSIAAAAAIVYDSPIICLVWVELNLYNSLWRGFF